MVAGPGSCATNLDWHAGTVHSDREQGPLPQHSLKAGIELYFGDGESVAEVERAVRVRVGEVAEPLGKLLPDLRGGEAFELVLSGGLDLEEPFRLPLRLVLELELAEFVAFARLGELDGVRGGVGHGADGDYTRETSGTYGTSPEGENGGQCSVDAADKSGQKCCEQSMSARVIPRQSAQIQIIYRCPGSVLPYCPPTLVQHLAARDTS